MKQQQYKISAAIRIKTNKKSSELVKESIKQDIEDTDSIQAKDDTCKDIISYSCGKSVL